MSGWSVNLTTLFLGRLRPPKRLTSTSCTYFRQVSNPGPLTYESCALPIALRDPAIGFMILLCIIYVRSDISFDELAAVP